MSGVAVVDEVSSALGLDRPPGPDDDLFVLGLDSLTVIRIAAAWRRRGVEVTFEQLAEEPTLRRWEAMLDGAGTAPSSAPVVGDEPGDEFDLAPMQHAYWVGRQDGQPFGGVGSHFYLEFDGHDVSAERLQAAFARVVARHDMLRMRITPDGRQRIGTTTGLARVAVHDLRELPDPDRELGALRERYSHRRFDTERGEVVELALSLLPGGATRLHLDLDMVAADAASLTVVLTDLALFYTDPGAAPPELRHDFRTHLASRDVSTERERDRAWWADRIADLPAGPVLPTRPDAGSARPATARLHHHLDPTVTGSLTAHARRAGVTPSAALAAAFAEVVAAFSGPRFVLNLPLFDRGPDPRTRGLVGDFTGSTLLDVDVSEHRAFVDSARDLQTRLHAAVGHSAFSGLDVLRERARRTGEPVLAPVVYTSAIGLGDLEPPPVRRCFGSAVWVSSQNPQVWLDAQVREQDGGLLLNWDARTDVLADGVPTRMFTAYRDLVHRLATDPQAWAQPLGALVADSSARDAANATARALPRRGLHQAFFIHAAEHPDAPAVIDDATTVSFGELADRALRVAAALSERGVAPGEPVVVTLPRGPDQVVAVLGVLAAGGCYVPVGTDQPPMRRARIVERAGARLILTDEQDRTVGAVPMQRCRETEPLPQPVPVDPDGPAYILFTSGSTGEPKGVEISHGAAVNTIESINARFDVGPGDRALLVSALDFDLSVYDVFGLLSAGGAVVALREDERRDPQRWWQLVHTHRVTVWNTVPVLLDMLLGAAPTGPGVPLRLVLLGGDRVGPDLPDRLHAIAPACRFVALGGMTEAAIHSTACEVDTPDPAWTSVPWGTPLDNVVCRVVDPRGRDCPDRVTGELWVGGAGVARGYRGDPERTADRFVTHGGVRWYRTGDLARYLPDGTLEFLGRADHQVKVRGHRIELGEVEAVLTTHPDVHRAVVVVLEAPARRLAAAVTGAADPVALRAWQADRLPTAMVCEQVVVLDTLPLTANGKPDRAAVRELLAGGDAAEPDAGTPPQGEVERAVAAVWAELLGVDRVRREDSFFALGGDSLLGTRLLGRLTAAGLSGARIGALFAHPRLHEFAATLGVAAGPTPPAGPQVVPDPEHRYEPFPATDVQQAYRLGRDHRFTLGGVGTWQYAEFDGADVDIARMDRAWRRLIARHEMLRAVVDPDGRQRILADPPEYAIAVQDLTDAAPVEVEAALVALRAESSHRLVDLTRWPLFELRAIRYRAGGAVRTRLAVGLDYILFDALSIMTLFTELDRLYTDPTTELAPIDLSFRDYLLQVVPDAEAAARAEQHWRARLDELPDPPQLPLRIDPALVTGPRFTRRTHRLPTERWAALTARARAHGLTASTVLLAGYAEVLARWSAAPELTVTLTLFNRREVHPHIDRVLGDFTSLTLADHRPAGTWLESARGLQQRLAGDLDHRDVSPSWLLRELGRRTGTLDAAVPVVFTSAIGVGTGVSMDPSAAFPERVWGLSQSPQVSLDNQVLESAGGLLVNWESVDELFCDGVLDAMFDAYARLLTHLATHDWHEPLPDLLPAAQRRVRDEVNDTGSARSAGLLHGPFFAGVAGHAGRAALITADATLTHDDVADRALRVGAALAARGVTPGDTVAITLPKGPDQVIAALGVLAAGAAYVPVGVDQPQRRREETYRLAGAVQIVDELAPLLLGDPLPAPVAVSPDSIAYVIFTSGSTGARKGVEVTHAAAANTVTDISERFAIGPDDRVLALSALDFDLSVYDVFGLLGAGGALVLPAEDERRDAAAWLRLASAHGVTVWNTVPVLLEMLLVAAGTAGLPAALRLALVSGDWVPLDLGERLGAATAPGFRLVALGGATEAAIWSNSCEVDVGRATPPHWPSVPYGLPLAAQRFRAVGPDGSDRPDWVAGELWIGGAGVARGYRGDVARTADRFVSHDGDRWYRTGDRGRFWPDGTLEFLGRTDHQVKIGGHRLELGEVEAALLEHPDVERAVVVAVGARTRRTLHALIATASGTGPPLDGFLADRLPAHAVPARRTVLAELPLTVNGKVDRAALQAFAERVGTGPVPESRPPDGPLEQAVAELWAELLDTAAPDRDTSFFTLGGTSLTALRLVTAIEERFGTEVGIRRFFAAPTVAALAAEVAAAGRHDDEIGTV